jgi:hypothetical protein
MVVVLANGNAQEVIPIDNGEGAARATMRVARWLNHCLKRVEETGVCISYTVGIHVAAADCDHEVPGKVPS